MNKDNTHPFGYLADQMRQDFKFYLQHVFQPQEFHLPPPYRYIPTVRLIDTTESIDVYNAEKVGI